MVQTLLRGLLLAVVFLCAAPMAQAQQYAAVVMDARTGRVVHEVNGDTRLHPASLTKMMTLYIVFDQVRKGRLSLDQKITVSANAAAEPPSKLGLKAGQTIELRYLIRAAAIKSANDAATAMGETVAGSEVKFADLMNQYARAMGMSNTSFRNANGLTAEGHLSSARDMAELGRRLYYDFPQYYNIFSRNSTSAGLATVRNTNRRLLDAYPGADGIKTGYTRAAGFNLVSSAQHGNQRVIVAMFGGKSSASRNAEVARLMDLGFDKMPRQARVTPPAPLRTAAPVVAAAEPVRQAKATPPTVIGSTAGVVAALVAATPVQTAALGESLRPRPRTPRPATEITRNSDAIADAIAEVNAELAAARAEQRPPSLAGDVAPPAPRPGAAAAAAVPFAPARTASASTFVVAPPAPPRVRATEPTLEPQGLAEPGNIEMASTGTGTTGGADWGVQLGAFRSKGDAERHLLTTALKDLAPLDGGLRRVEAAKVQGVTIYRAQFVGLSQDRAVAACADLARLQADCLPLAPGI